jgi:hypothetical protein
MQAVAQACRVLAEPNKTEMDAYNTYLAIRADWLGLNAQDRTYRVVIRVGAMLRLFTPEEGILLKEAILKLDKKMQTRLIEQFDIREGEELESTPTYVPAVLVNLSNNPKLGSSKEERITQTILIGLPFVARVLENHKQALAENKANPAIPLNFNKAAGVAKSDPNKLLNTFEIDAEGNVSPVSM